MHTSLSRWQWRQYEEIGRDFEVRTCELPIGSRMGGLAAEARQQGRSVHMGGLFIFMIEKAAELLVGDPRYNYKHRIA